MRGAILLAICSVACGGSAPAHSPDALERSARLLRQLDRLEADLHGVQAEGFTNSVLVERHARAEQMACKVTDEHLADITRLQALQQVKIERRRQERAAARRRSVAQLTQRHGSS
jgi:hypothetical protein